jgi:hypothetical protein
MRWASVVGALIFYACGVPDYSGFDDQSSGGSSAGGTSGDAGAGNDAGASGDAGSSGDSGDADAGCSSNADCTVSGLGVCDTTSGACVQCLPSDDTCPAGTYCGSDNTCTVGCNDDSDCVPAPKPDGGSDGGIIQQDGAAGAAGSGGAAGAAGAGGVGGVTPTDGSTGDGGTQLTCDTTQHLCVGCQLDSECPIGTICDNANQTCIPGCLVKDTCPSGFDCCGKQCVDTNVDVDHCGACDVPCTPYNGTGSCQGGQCTVGGCDPGFGDCNQDATDGCESQLAGDPSNCGACGSACPKPTHALAQCQGSACGMGSCEPGFADCNNSANDGCEANLGTDVGNCGACNFACSLLNANPGCSAGTCTILSCNAGFGDCDTTASTGCETNTQSNVNNCGTCGKSCSFPNAGAACTAGLCKPGNCVAPYQNCDGNDTNGCESNKTSDPNNCGSCGNVCLLPHATASCDNGTCAIASCNSGYADCDGLDSNGCEVNLATNASNCGTCGTICGTNNANPVCTAGSCVENCNAGYANCDGNAANGCEVNTSSNVSNCGTCNNVCPTPGGGTPNCVGGICGISSCTPPQADCNGNSSDGCEINTSNNVNNCGTCGNVCFAANGTAGCSSGNCTVASCNTGFANCDGLYSNGCEKNLKTDPLNCNACGNVCSTNHGTASCSSGACGITCSAGYSNCNGLVSDGCEISITTTSNCGSCGTTCSNTHGSTACTAGACVPTCAAGWADCDGNPNNGCETSTTTLTNCGSCGSACSLPNATPDCSTGSCQVSSCNTGFGNCDGTTSNGCETNTNTAVSDCGGCNLACSNNNGSPSCSAGNCSIVCNAGYLNCDGNARSNGCEINKLTDNNNCGSCGNACTGGKVCINGTCQSTSCNPGTYNCDGSGCNCSGTGCCSTSCQTQHDNGLGQHYYDCNSQGTYTSVTANEACTAFTGSAGLCSGFQCTGPGKPQLVCSNLYSVCACWAYTGGATGHVYNSGTTGCYCPITGDPSWN